MHKTVDNKIDQWFEDRGIVANGKTMSQAIKTLEETTELIDAINTNNLLEIVDAVGDIYVTLRGVCIVEGIDLSFCAEAAYNEIKDRKGYLRADGTFVKEHDRLPEKLMSDENIVKDNIQSIAKNAEVLGWNEHNPWQMSEELERVIDIANSRFSIGDICDLWYVVYGENMKEEYPGFVDELEKRIS